MNIRPKVVAQLDQAWAEIVDEVMRQAIDDAVVWRQDWLLTCDAGDLRRGASDDELEMLQRFAAVAMEEATVRGFDRVAEDLQKG